MWPSRQFPVDLFPGNVPPPPPVVFLSLFLLFCFVFFYQGFVSRTLTTHEHSDIYVQFCT